MKSIFNFSFVLGLMLIIVGIVRLFNGIDIVSIFAIALGIMEIFLSLGQRNKLNDKTNMLQMTQNTKTKF